MLRSKVSKWFDERVDKKLKKGSREVRDYLKKHERKNLFVNNLIKEVRKCELRHGLTVDVVKIKKIVFDLTDVFMKTAIDVKLREVRCASVIKEEKKSEFDKTEDEIKEEFKEMGVIEVERSYKSD